MTVWTDTIVLVLMYVEHDGLIVVVERPTVDVSVMVTVAVLVTVLHAEDDWTPQPWFWPQPSPCSPQDPPWPG